MIPDRWVVASSVHLKKFQHKNEYCLFFEGLCRLAASQDFQHFLQKFLKRCSWRKFVAWTDQISHEVLFFYSAFQTCWIHLQSKNEIVLKLHNNLLAKLRKKTREVSKIPMRMEKIFFFYIHVWKAYRKNQGWSNGWVFLTTHPPNKTQ